MPVPEHKINWCRDVDVVFGHVNMCVCMRIGIQTTGSDFLISFNGCFVVCFYSALARIE